MDKNNNNEKLTKVGINWYPGHMAKATREIKEQLKNIDLIVEVLDARIPLSSSNPELEKIAVGFPRIIVLNKKDKADQAVTKLWLKALKKDTNEVIAIDAYKDDLKKQLSIIGESLIQKKREKESKKGINPLAIRTLVVGIPNTGKSTIINKIAGRKVAQSADHPGVTKRLTWIKTDSKLALLDTPGILWPKIDDQKVGLRLAITGAIKDEILSTEDLTYFALDYLSKNYPDNLKERYKLTELGEPETILQAIGKNRGMLRAGGLIDRNRCEEMLIKEIRDERLGRISWEKPA